MSVSQLQNEMEWKGQLALTHVFFYHLPKLPRVASGIMPSVTCSISVATGRVVQQWWGRWVHPLRVPVLQLSVYASSTAAVRLYIIRVKLTKGSVGSGSSPSSGWRT